MKKHDKFIRNLVIMQSLYHYEKQTAKNIEKIVKSDCDMIGETSPIETAKRLKDLILWHDTAEQLYKEYLALVETTTKK